MTTTPGTKLDLRREFKELHAPTATPKLVDVPELLFLMVDGKGDPNTSPEYREAVAALYAVAYALKFMIKRAPDGVDYSVMPLEGFWWADNMAEFSLERKEDWRWTMMIAQPDAVTPARFEQAVTDVARKKNLPALARLRLAPFAEGLSGQVLHRGPYSAEGSVISDLHAFIREPGYTFDGQRQKHHEIYLSDPTRTAPEKLTTVLRQPAAPPASGAG